MSKRGDNLGAEQSRAEQSRAEQSRAEQSRAEQSRAEQSRAEQSVDVLSFYGVFYLVIIYRGNRQTAGGR
ncbi:hypothetical protein BRYFOR_07811 [Marvinbryantia formatexigens DSM 14469]|uniref:Uncharacterized protein n=1 Tax=Marvinbryantia formatexigens DSM 14469 TaxID=478749 RepID=C6LGQ1_9FIRM|nr:hypothetical protein [Marvinbryantia formatexigens]EET60251.1 hypothetical protein BRYFOR_07811 [Marvinbryantia formatexigens DSM 14469]UWO24272.1 hypothetical protein NQ534_17885 [Marvinbryantia formatexigens DSM 14469]